MNKLIPAAVGIVAMAVAGCCSCANKITKDFSEKDFVSIFNGKDLTGWTGATVMYGVDPKEPGILQCFPERKGQQPEGLFELMTVKTYRNFILRFDFVMPPNGNNGLGIRMQNPKDDAAYYAMCELQLLDDGGSLYYDPKGDPRNLLDPFQYTGSVYGVVPCRRDNIGRKLAGREQDFAGGGSYVHRPGMWNSEEVRVVGEEIEVRLNGELITKADLSQFVGNGDTLDHQQHPGLHNTSGSIGWLGHGHNVKWKNIRILELPDDAKMSDL